MSYSQQNNVAEENKTHTSTLHTTSANRGILSRSAVVAVIINYANCGARDMTYITGLMEKELASLKKMKVIPSTEAKKMLGIKTGVPCVTDRCAREYAAKLSADFILVGLIDRNAQEYNKPLDDSGKYPYLKEVIKNEIFKCSIVLFDATGNNKIISVVEKLKRPELAGISKKISLALDSFVGDGIIESAEGKRQVTKNRPDFDVMLFGSAIVPVGRLRSVFLTGCGMGLNLGISRVFMQNDIFVVSSKYDFYSFKAAGTTFYSSFDVMLLWGMSFTLARQFRLVPLFGVGCQVSYARFNDIMNNPMYRYAHPQISVRLEGDIILPLGFAVIITPEFSAFFEKKSIGMYAGAQIGARYTF